MKPKTLTNTVLFLFFVVVIAITLMFLRVRYEDVGEINEDGDLVIVDGDIYEVVE